MASASKNVPVPLNKICRTCMTESPEDEMKILYKDCISKVCIVEMLMSCTFVSFVEEDGLPNQICQECINEVTRAYKFSQKCEKIDKILRNQLKVPKQTKRVSSKNLKSRRKRKEKKSKKDSKEQLENSTDEEMIGIKKKMEVLEEPEKSNNNLATPIKKENTTNFSYESFTEFERQYNMSENPEEKVNGQVYISEEVFSKFEDQYYQIQPNKSEDIIEVVLKSNHSIEKAEEISNSESDSEVEQNHSESKSDIEHMIDSENKSDSENKIDINKQSLNPERISKSLKIKRKEAYEQFGYICEICGEKFRLSRLLLNHFTKTNCGKRSCIVCSKTLSYAHFKSHMRTHTGETPYECNICDKSFAFKTNLTRHLKSHTGIKPFQCEECGKTFTNKLGLKEHKNLHTGLKPYVCKICGKKFPQSTGLNAHIRRHAQWDAPATAKIQFQCEICDKKLKSKDTLKAHKLIHREKKYICAECGKAYARLGLLKNHQKNHSEIKQKKAICSMCDEVFQSKNLLRIHLKSHVDKEKNDK